MAVSAGIAVGTGSVLLPVIADAMGVPVLACGLHGTGPQLAVGLAGLPGMNILELAIFATFSRIIIAASNFLRCFKSILILTLPQLLLSTFFCLVFHQFKP